MLAEWIDAELPYSSLWFFPRLWAVNVSWHEEPDRSDYSDAVTKGLWR
ncbi:MAG: hypothetical protein KDE07_09040 [Sphingomonadaceae bacterium]|nr:hypothetical protein [Sphingomonadaceae bacterium]